MRKTAAGWLARLNPIVMRRPSGLPPAAIILPNDSLTMVTGGALAVSAVEKSRPVVTRRPSAEK
jgi:hypothetical protein